MDKKKTLLYVSPFWPKQSGISEYSSHLVQGLSAEFDVTLLTDGYHPITPGLSDYPVLYPDSNKIASFDYIIYNFGNCPDYHYFMLDLLDKHPGYVILHDFSLYYLMTYALEQKGDVLSDFYARYGKQIIADIKYDFRKTCRPFLLASSFMSAKYPLNEEVLFKAKGIFTHSEYTKQNVQKIVGDKIQVKSIYHVENILENLTDLKKSGRELMRKKLNIPTDARIIGAAGFIAETKQNLITARAVKHYNETHTDKLYYCMIGAGDVADKYIDKYILKTGFVDNDEFFPYIAACDVIANLRWPYGGETSGPLLQSMAMGKPCIVTDVGYFSEIPDTAVIKVPHDITEADLETIIGKAFSSDALPIGQAAYNYVADNCNAYTIAKLIRAFMEDTSARH